MCSKNFWEERRVTLLDKFDFLEEFDLGELENDQRPDWEDEKVSTTIVEKDKDFFNQNPQLDKRLLVGANHGFEETKTPDTKSMQNQLLQFQAQIKAQQQQQSPVKQQQPIQHLTLQQQLQQQLQINQFQQPQTQPESKLQPTIMKSAEPSVDFFKISFEDDIKYNDDFKNADDERINAAFNQFSFKSNYETDIESFVKTLSVGVPTTFNKTSRLTGLNNPETKIINPQVIEAPKTSHPDFMVQQLPQFKREAPKENTNTNILGGPKKRPTPMYPSFVFRYYSSEYEQQNWYYLDNEEKKCGPFSGKDMDKWYGDGTLPLELKVTIGENNQCKTIKEIADYIVAKTINGDGPPPEKKPKPQNEMIAKLMTQIGDKADLVTAGDHPPLKAKTLDEIEVPVNYEKWAPPLVKVDKKKDHDKNHGDRQHNNYKRNNYHNNNEQGHNNYKNNYQNQNNKYGHNNQNYNQNYQNQGNNYNNEQNKDQNNYMKPKTLVSRPGGNMVQNFNNQSGQPLIPTNNLNQSAPNEATLQIKGLLGMVKPEIKTQQQQQTQIQVNQVPKIDQADFPSLGETYMK